MKTKRLNTVILTSGILSIMLPVIAGSAISIFNNKYTEDAYTQQKIDQQNIFKSVDKNDIENRLDEMFNNNEIMTPSYQSSQSKLISSETNPDANDALIREKELTYKNDILSNADKIINGDILISDLENKYLESIQGDEESLKGYIELKNAGNAIDGKQILLQQNQSASVPHNTNEYVQLTYEENGIFTNSDKIRDVYQYYAATSLISATAATAMTAISWSISAYYWCAWWMFGANIPIAAAATTQAISLTISAGIAWHSYSQVLEVIYNFKELEANKYEHIENAKKIFQNDSVVWLVSYNVFGEKCTQIITNLAIQIICKFPQLISAWWYWKAKMLHFSGKIWKGKMLQIYN